MSGMRVSHRLRPRSDDDSLRRMIYTPLLCALLAGVAVFGILRGFGSGTVAAAEEQAVILKLKLTSGKIGSDEERQRIQVLEGRLADSIKRFAVRDFDGDEYGDGYCMIYMYGPSAESLFI
jgi:hypothetical protein